MEWISLVISVVGLIATSIGAWLAYVTFISPLRRFKWYLRKPDKWEKEFEAKGSEFYRPKQHPEFQIVRSENPTVTGFTQPWMKKYPDMEHNQSYIVEVRFHGTFLMSELFIALDGWRYFVPVPRVESAGLPPHLSTDKDTRTFHYDELQVRLSRIIGDYYRMDTIEQFAKAHKIPIRQSVRWWQKPVQVVLSVWYRVRRKAAEK